MRRRSPGRISNNQLLKPKYRHTLGSFGKGFIAPLPKATSTSVPVTDGKTDKTAIDKSTGKFYIQDPKCPSGQITTKWSEPCIGPGCAPGETKTGEECLADPNYAKLMKPPPGGFQSCQEWDLFGYPKGECNKKNCPTCFGRSQQPQKRPQTKVAKATRPALSIPFKGSCPKTHFKATDAMGDFCKPCPPGLLFHKGKCKPKPPPCECGLPRQGDPDFGPCKPAPKSCGPPPRNQRCKVPGQGIMNPVCKCGVWKCPTNKDILIAKFKRMGKPIPKGVAGYEGFGGYKKPLLGLAVVGVLIGLLVFVFK